MTKIGKNKLNVDILTTDDNVTGAKVNYSTLMQHNNNTVVYHNIVTFNRTYFILFKTSSDSSGVIKNTVQ